MRAAAPAGLSSIHQCPEPSSRAKLPGSERSNPTPSQLWSREPGAQAFATSAPDLTAVRSDVSAGSSKYAPRPRGRVAKGADRSENLHALRGEVQLGVDLLPCESAPEMSQVFVGVPGMTHGGGDVFDPAGSECPVRVGRAVR